MFKVGDYIEAVITTDPWKNGTGLIKGNTYRVMALHGYGNGVSVDGQPAQNWYRNERFKQEAIIPVLPLPPTKETPVTPPTPTYYVGQRLRVLGHQLRSEAFGRFRELSPGDEVIVAKSYWAAGYKREMFLLEKDPEGYYYDTSKFEPIPEPVILPTIAPIMTTTTTPFNIGDIIVAATVPGNFRIKPNTPYEVRGFDAKGYVLLKSFPHGYDAARFTLVSPTKKDTAMTVDTAAPAAPAKQADKVMNYYIVTAQPARNCNFTGTEAQAREKAVELLKAVPGEVYLTVLMAKVKLGEKPVVWE